MHGWKIHVEGVRGVLVTVTRAGEELSLREGDVSALASDVGPVLRPARRAGRVVGGVLEAHAHDVGRAAARARQCLDGASLATLSYLEGDEAMAEHTAAAQRAAAGGR